MANRFGISALRSVFKRLSRAPIKPTFTIDLVRFSLAVMRRLLFFCVCVCPAGGLVLEWNDTPDLSVEVHTHAYIYIYHGPQRTCADSRKRRFKAALFIHTYVEFFVVDGCRCAPT